MRFFFHIQYEDELAQDTEGADFTDITTARLEAFQAARELVVNHMHEDFKRVPHALVLADENGTQLDTVTLKSTIPDVFR